MTSRAAAHAEQAAAAAADSRRELHGRESEKTKMLQMIFSSPFSFLIKPQNHKNKATLKRQAAIP
jgi:hypothetical protein